MKKLFLYVFLGLITCSFANAGWFSKELYLNCEGREDGKVIVEMILKITNKEWCMINPDNPSEKLCSKTAVLNSEIAKTEILDPATSSTAEDFGQKVYYKLDRNLGTVAVYSAANNKMISVGAMVCETRPKL